jgi:hypothetical protein
MAAAPEVSTMRARLTHPLRFLALVALAAAPTAAFAGRYWFEDYERAVALLRRGDAEMAAPILAGVMAAHPVPILGLLAPGDRFLDYRPYYHRALIEFHQGRLAEAAHSLRVGEAFGEFATCKRYKTQALTLREKIDGRQRPEAQPAAAAVSR